MTLTQAASIALVIVLAVAACMGVKQFFNELERRLNR